MSASRFQDHVAHAFGACLTIPSYSQQYSLPLTEWKLAYGANPALGGSTSTVIAIVDSGIDLNHPDLAAKILAGMSFVARRDAAGRQRPRHMSASATMTSVRPDQRQPLGRRRPAADADPDRHAASDADPHTAADADPGRHAGPGADASADPDPLRRSVLVDR